MRGAALEAIGQYWSPVYSRAVMDEVDPSGYPGGIKGRREWVK